MSAPKRLNYCIKSLQALALAATVCFSLGVSDSGSRFNDLNHRLMCTCGCAQVLGDKAIASGATDDQILTSFAAKYGATVLAAPTTKGFDLVAWIAPFAVFAAALLGTILLVRRWSVGRSQAAQAAGSSAVDPEMNALREKVRRETGSGSDGGF
jgi:cytochrome c-type biogenesis protein CcmH